MSSSTQYHTGIIRGRPTITSRSTDTDVLRQIGPWRLRTPPRPRTKSEGSLAYGVFKDESETASLSFSEIIQKIDEECAMIKEAQDQEPKFRDSQAGRDLPSSSACMSHQLGKKQICDLLLTFLGVVFVFIAITPPVTVYLMSSIGKFQFVAAATNLPRRKSVTFLPKLASITLLTSFALAIILVLHVRSPSTVQLRNYHIILLISCLIGWLLAGWITLWVNKLFER